MTIRSRPGSITISGHQLNPVLGPQQPYIRTYDTSEVYVGGDNPRWLEAVKAGTNATNALEAKKSFVDFQPVNMQALTWWKNPPHRHGAFTDGVIGYPLSWEPTMPDAEHSSTALAECVARFNQKLQDQMRPVQGLAFLGEVGETIRMLKHAGRRLTTHIGDYVRDAKRYLQSSHKTRKALKGISNLWLEYAFGWTPLFNDMAAAVRTLAVPREKRIIIRAYGESRTITAQPTNPVFVGVLLEMICDQYQRDTSVSSAQQVAALDFSLVGQPDATVVDSIQSAADRWGLVARQFIPAVWELIPYSFLIDYYTNLGTIIDAAFADRRAIAWSYQTQRTTVVRERRWSNCRENYQKHYFPIITSNTPGFVKVGTKRFTRKSGLQAIPPITIGYPDFGGVKYANQLALILGRLKTR